MRLVFAGTPQFAALALLDLLRRGHEVVSVLTQPDRRKGRSLKLTISPVKAVALEYGIAVQQPQSLKPPEVVEGLRQLRADVWVVAAYGLILPAAVLQIPPRGCLNIHASLLPRWRGAAPIQRAIMAGDRETGISIMQMDEGLDTGPVLLRRAVPIDSSATGGSLHDRLAQLGARSICEVLDSLAIGDARAEPQSSTGACYAAKLRREEARIDWGRPAAEIERTLRALDPVPGAYTDYEGSELKLWRGVLRSSSGEGPPGTIVAVDPLGIEVRGVEANLALTELQRPGGRRLGVGEFIRGFTMRPGARFGP